MKSVPSTYMALVDDKILRIVSWEAYEKEFPRHTRRDYKKLIQHEIAHQLHVELAGDEGMGPIWFYEGFATVAANQYENTEKLSEMEFVKILKSEKRGNYKDYSYVLRELIKKWPLSELIQMAFPTRFELVSSP